METYSRSDTSTEQSSSVGIQDALVKSGDSQYSNHENTQYCPFLSPGQTQILQYVERQDHHSYIGRDIERGVEVPVNREVYTNTWKSFDPERLDRQTGTQRSYRYCDSVCGDYRDQDPRCYTWSAHDEKSEELKHCREFCDRESNVVDRIPEVETLMLETVSFNHAV